MCEAHSVSCEETNGQGTTKNSNTKTRVSVTKSVTGNKIIASSLVTNGITKSESVTGTDDTRDIRSIETDVTIKYAPKS